MTTYTKEDIGCIVDEPDARLAILQVIDLAVIAGFKLTPSDPLALKAFLNQDNEFVDAFGIKHSTGEWVLKEKGLADEVIHFFNSIAPEDTVFHWHESKFYLSPLEKNDAE